MITKEWLDQNVKQLAGASIATARLDCLILLGDATGKDRSYILAHAETALTSSQLGQLSRKIERRKNHEPLAYIRGKTEFYGREFMVNKHTLEPRPETETMVDLLKQILGLRVKGEGLRVVDVGTGSGCIAITAKLENPELEVIGTDLSKECLKVARQNGKSLNADVKFLQGDLLQPLSTLQSSPFALLCNLPYVPDSHTINQAAMQEPKLAIFGGSDGLDVYRELFEQIKKFESKPKYILTEALPFQHAALAGIAKESGYELRKSDDFIQVFQGEASSAKR